MRDLKNRKGFVYGKQGRGKWMEMDITEGRTIYSIDKHVQYRLMTDIEIFFFFFLMVFT